MSVDLSAYLTQIKNERPREGVALQILQDAVNQLALAVGADPTQHIEPPHAPQGINVAAGSDQVHVTVSDSSQRSRALSYFVEWDTDPNFPQPHMEHLGTGRGRVLALPAMDADSNPYTYYFRTYSSYLSSKTASPKLNFGGTVPTPVTLSGASQLTLLPSTGGGTASSTGQQAGQGFGHAQFAQPSGKPVLS